MNFNAFAARLSAARGLNIEARTRLIRLHLHLNDLAKRFWNAMAQGGLNEQLRNATANRACFQCVDSLIIIVSVLTQDIHGQ